MLRNRLDVDFNTRRWRSDIRTKGYNMDVGYLRLDVRDWKLEI